MQPKPHAIALWPLPLLAAVLPLVAALAALFLSMHLGLVPRCNPFVEGCVSVSRAARHDLPNHLFRALMLPAATLQALVWVLAMFWLRQQQPSRALRWVAPLGVAAGVALVLYGSFLGTEGQVYRWLRQYGTVVYFGCTCLCFLLAGRAVQSQCAAGLLKLPRWLVHGLVLLGVALVLLGVGNSIVAALFGGELKDRVENITEWWGSLVFVLGFLLLAQMWRRLGLVWQLSRAADP
jgi:hypothetical protein